MSDGPRVIYDELGPDEIDAMWIDKEGDYWRYERPNWEWNDGGVWEVAVPLAHYGPYSEAAS